MVTLSILSLVLLPSASAATVSCDVYPTSTCASSVASVTTTSSAAVAQVNMASGTYQRLDLFATVCDPSGWVLHLADSPTNDGYGGDSTTTDHDAEAYLYGGYDFAAYSATDKTRSKTAATLLVTDAVQVEDLDASSGCVEVRMSFANATSTSAPTTIEFEPDPTGALAYPPAAGSMASLYGPRLGYIYGTTSAKRGVEQDKEDSASTDLYYWYVGVNRLYGSTTRTGGGVRAACIVLSTSASTEPSTCL